MPVNNNSQITIPVEIISDQEMALIEAAFSLASAATRRISSPSSSPLSLLNPISFASNKQFSTSVVCDVEDLGRIKSPQKKKPKVSDSFLSRFRKKRGLSVTDLTSTEWCEKQMEYFLLFGKPERTNAMKAGVNRHAKLEEEISRKVEVRVETLEDIWALKFINFIICANQLLFDGLTREVPVCLLQLMSANDVRCCHRGTQVLVLNSGAKDCIAATVI